MGNLYKREKVWYIDLRADGRRIRRRVGTSKEVALLALKDAEVNSARRQFGFLTTEVTVEKLFANYLEYSKTNHRPITTTRYRAVIDHFREFLKLHPEIVMLSHVTPAVIDRYKAFRKESWVNPNGYPITGDSDRTPHSRKGAKSHTINFEVGTLRTIFFQAIKWGWLKDNPTKGVTKLKITETKQPRFLTDDECQKLLSASPPSLHAIFFTFLNTGMRKGELENLEWKDIDLKRKKINIHSKPFWQPKTGERVIPINDPLLELLRVMKAKNDKTVKSAFVFCDKKGHQLKIKLRDHLIRIAQEIGLADLTKIHTLRHTFASQLVMKGVDLPTVQKLLGHSDIQTTMIYSHLAADHLADAVNKLKLET